MKSYLKRNKPLLFLPLILIPFIVLIFYVLGGGEHPKEGAPDLLKKDSVKGANYKLPDADRNIQIFDKMESAQSKQELAQTRDYDILGEKDSLDKVLLLEEQGTTEPSGAEETGKSPGLNADVSNNLLAHIRRQEELARKDMLKGQNDAGQGEESLHEPNEESKTLDKTSDQGIKTTGIEELDNVFRQNIELARKNDSLDLRLKESTAKNEKTEAERNKSFALEKDGKSGFKPKETAVPVIEAEVYETATVLSGNRVKLRLLEEAWLNGVKIPINTFLYGICEVSNERLQIEVFQIPVGEKFVPVEVTVCDLDGLPGLYVPDNASRKVAKEVGSSTNTSSMFGMTDNPLAYAGVQAADKTAQSIFRLIKIKKVTIKKNTLVYLINKSK
jgi:conjugative transposon TraM protein